MFSVLYAGDLMCFYVLRVLCGLCVRVVCAFVRVSEISWSPASEKELGEVKLSISYKNDKLFIMVMHIRGLVSLTQCVCVTLLCNVLYSKHITGSLSAED